MNATKEPMTTRKAMTQQQAQKEAEKRWGSAGCTSIRPNAITKEQRAAIAAKPRKQRTFEEQIYMRASWRCTGGNADGI